MKFLRFLIRLAFVLPWVIFGLIMAGVVFHGLSATRRRQLHRSWSRVLMRVCGVRIVVQGEPCMSGPVFWVANHVSWVDIFVLNSVRATAFVAKSEIRSWPVIGWLVAWAGTLFIERGQRHALQAMAQAMQQRFQAGDAVGLFPAGTTILGLELLPFHAALFEPARMAGIDIQPVALRYMQDGRRSSFASFVGEETLVANMWRLLGATGVSVEVVYLPYLPIHNADGAVASRQELSRRSHEAISAQL